MLCTPALSGDCPTQRLSKYLPTLPSTHNIAVFVGAMARGRDDFADAYVDEKISISEYSLSASVACGKVFFSFSYFFRAIWAVLTTDFFLVLLCVGRTLGHCLTTIPLPICMQIFWLSFDFCVFLNVIFKWAFSFLEKRSVPTPKSALQLAEFFYFVMHDIFFTFLCTSWFELAY